jgi:uncharacterized protein YjiS (DUF1127 family)
VISNLVSIDFYEEQCRKNENSRLSLSIVRRNHLLMMSDWSMLPDNGLSEEKREEWMEYRQALRDLNEQSDFPENIVWPTPPTK